MHELLLPLLLLGAPAGADPGPAPDPVTIYRCAGADGQLALQDFPCADDEQQQVRTMVRPQDPPPRPEADPDPVETVSEPAPTTVDVVVRTPPRPMFECVTPDGERYTSDSGEGNPRRAAPAWNYWPGGRAGPAPGVPPGPRSTGERRASGVASRGMSTSPGPSLTAPSRGQATAPPSRPRPPGHRHPPIHGYGGGDGWIRDQCHRLPQGQVCGILGDRRSEIRRRIFNAQPTERAMLRDEERGITARLNEDCNIR